MNRAGLTRRSFLGATAAGTILAAGSPKAFSADNRDGSFPGLPKDGTVRDRLWIWGGAPGATNDEWGHAASRMTAAEAAFYMTCLHTPVGPADPGSLEALRQDHFLDVEIRGSGEL